LIGVFRRPRNNEIFLHKGSEIEIRLTFFHIITLNDGSWIVLGNGIGERLAVREDALHLHVFEQLIIEL